MENEQEKKFKAEVKKYKKYMAALNEWTETAEQPKTHIDYCLNLEKAINYGNKALFCLQSIFDMCNNNTDLLKYLEDENSPISNYYSLKVKIKLVLIALKENYFEHAKKIIKKKTFKKKKMA